MCYAVYTVILTDMCKLNTPEGLLTGEEMEVLKATQLVQCLIELVSSADSNSVSPAFYPELWLPSFGSTGKDTMLSHSESLLYEWKKKDKHILLAFTLVNCLF